MISMPYVVAIINQKGGTGKTTTSINLGAGLAYGGYKTLLIDFDPQAHTTIGLGIEPDSCEESIAEVMTIPRKSIQDVVIECYIKNLFIVPSHIRLARAAELIITRNFREAILFRAIREINYDFVLIDCPPALGVLAVNSIYAANFIIIPCQMSRYSLDGLADLINTIEEVKDAKPEEMLSKDIFRILITMYDRRNKITNEYIKNELYHYSQVIFDTIIMKCEALNQSNIAQVSIYDYDPNSQGAKDYKKLVGELINIARLTK